MPLAEMPIIGGAGRFRTGGLLIANVTVIRLFKDLRRSWRLLNKTIMPLKSTNQAHMVRLGFQPFPAHPEQL